LNALPQNFDALMRLAAVRTRLGDDVGATDCYRRAVEVRPNDLTAVEKYTDGIWKDDPERAVKLREALVAAVWDDVPARISALYMLICQKEWSERLKRGQMPYHALSLDELFFHHAQKYLLDLQTAAATRLAEKPDDVHAIRSLGFARFAQKDRRGAETLFRSVAAQKKGGSIFDTVMFTPEFYDHLRETTDEQLFNGLPPLMHLTPFTPNPAGVLYLSCDYQYLHAFALPMILSLQERSPQAQIHVHIMDATKREASCALAMLDRMPSLRFALSTERSGLRGAPLPEARNYYHAVRFVRFFQHMQLYRSPLWLMDVDAVINRDLSDLFELLNDRDVSMRIRPGRLEPWNQFNACVVGAGTTDASFEYFRLIAAYIAYFYQHKKLQWGIDQLAMYGAFADMQDRGRAPSLALLDDRAVDYDYHDDGYVWCNSGGAKFRHLQRLSNPDAPTLASSDENRFKIIFEEYWKESMRSAAEVGAPWAPPPT